jgi:hypothetical protein
MDRRVIVVILVVAVAICSILLYVGFRKKGRRPLINVENVGRAR